MAQRKPDAERSKRRGSENRQRQKIVAVRLNPAEYAALSAVAARAGKPDARVLREAFLLGEAALAERARQRREADDG